jgi:hypothetical protein
VSRATFWRSLPPRQRAMGCGAAGSAPVASRAGLTACSLSYYTEPVQQCSDGGHLGRHRGDSRWRQLRRQGEDRTRGLPRRSRSTWIRPAAEGELVGGTKAITRGLWLVSTLLTGASVGSAAGGVKLLRLLRRGARSAGSGERGLLLPPRRICHRRRGTAPEGGDEVVPATHRKDLAELRQRWNPWQACRDDDTDAKAGKAWAVAGR